jgi:tRNA modification GTPase
LDGCSADVTSRAAAAVDTIFALASGRLPAAIAIVRVSGPLAFAAGSALAGRLPEPRLAGLRKLVDPRGSTVIDQAVVVRFVAPASSTGEDIVEFHIHGGRAVASALLDALTSLDGLRAAEAGEFTRRAFENGRIDLTEAEGLADLIDAETETQRRAALALAEGGLRRQVEVWRGALLGLSARAEAAIDYAEEDEVGVDPELARDCAALAAELEQWLDQPRVEPLRDGLRVVVAGPPNAGKSSLVNALAGSERAIVTDVPGTTRDSIEVPLALAGIPLLLTDTAGLRESDDEVERIGVARARSLVQRADILLWLGEEDAAPQHDRLIRVYPRCDLAERHQAPSGSLRVSSFSGEGLGELKERIAATAASLIPHVDAIALNRRQAALVAEAQVALARSASAIDLALAAEDIRAALSAFDRLTGSAGVENMLDALFGRFCLGK